MADAKIPLPACDCLNFCGDDPWLASGKAEPCDAVKRRKRQREQDAAERLTVIEHLQAMAATATESNAAVLSQAAQLIARHPY